MRIIYFILILIIIGLLPACFCEASQIQDVNIQDEIDSYRIISKFDETPEFSHFFIDDNPRIVLDFQKTSHALKRYNFEGTQDGVINGLRTSQFKLEPEPVTRLVIDLQKNLPYSVYKTENGIIEIKLPKETAINSETTEFPETMKPNNTDPDNNEINNEIQNNPQSNRNSDSKKSIINSEREEVVSNKFKEKQITLDLKDAELTDLLLSLAEINGKSIILGSDISGKVTVKLKDVTWRDAFEIILKTNNLVSIEETDGVLRVITLKAQREEEINSETIKKRKQELIQLDTKILKIKNASAKEYTLVFKDMVSSRGSIKMDERTNSLIITDIPDNIQTIEQMLNQLDVETPQVEIEARLVQIDSNLLNEMGVNWNIFKTNGGIRDTVLMKAAEALITGGEPYSSIFFGTTEKNVSIDALIAAIEKNEAGEIIATPRITTMDNREATILTGEKIPLKILDASGNTVTQLFEVGTKLIVTPHITCDNKISMELHPERSSIAAVDPTIGPRIATQEADTRLTVDNGETAIIGGFKNKEEQSTNKGIPYLSRIPILGKLFKYSRKYTVSRDLIIFVTPRILNS